MTIRNTKESLMAARQKIIIGVEGKPVGGVEQRKVKYIYRGVK